MHRILACLNTLLDLVLDPGWNQDYQNFERRQAEVHHLLRLIESEQISLLIPHSLITVAHLSISTCLGRQQAHQVVQELLRLGNTHLMVDTEPILEQGNTLLLQGDEQLDLYEAMLIPYAIALKADAIVAQHPTLLTSLVYANDPELADFEVPILGLARLFDLMEQMAASANDDEIYVYTPQHLVKRLPKGATPVDFAYAIHTRLGDRCEKALVDGVEVPLDTVLRTNSVVEIVKGETPGPDPHWLTFVKTATARKAIARGLRRTANHRGWALIKQTLGKNVRSYRQKLDQAAESRGLTPPELVAHLGTGKITPEDLQDWIDQSVFQQVDYQAVVTPLADGGSGAPGTISPLLHLASCCYPLPGDSIVALVGRNKRTLRIHRADCSNVSGLSERQIKPVDWNCDRCQIQLLIVMQDSPDIVRPILNRLVDLGLVPNFRRLDTAADGTVKLSVELSVTSRPHLDHILEQLKTMPRVLRVKVTKLMPSGVRGH